VDESLSDLELSGFAAAASQFTAIIDFSIITCPVKQRSFYHSSVVKVLSVFRRHLQSAAKQSADIHLIVDIGASDRQTLWFWSLTQT
jgi:Mor family transcriptional regulator